MKNFLIYHKYGYMVIIINGVMRANGIGRKYITGDSYRLHENLHLQKQWKIV